MGAGTNVVPTTTARTTTWGETVLANATAGAFAVTLPAPAWGRDAITIKNVGTANNVTVTRSGSALIDGAGTFVLGPGQAITLVPDSTNWQILSKLRAKPGAPVIGVATAGVAQVVVAFSPPASDGGAAVSRYTATLSPGGNTATGGASPITVAAVNDVAYTATVHATNVEGDGPESAASNSVTPTGTPDVPGAPTGVTASAGNGQITVDWTHGAANGSAIIDGRVKVYRASDNTLLSTSLVGGSTPSKTVTGLTNGVAVYAKVESENGIGFGPQSAASSTVTPVNLSPLVTSYTPTTTRADITGWLGFRFTVGASPLTVTHVGRLVQSGNSATHVVKLVKASDLTNVAGGSATVVTAGVTPDTFAYTSLAAPVTLDAGATYYLLAHEVASGDVWLTATAAVLDGAVSALVPTYVQDADPGTYNAFGSGQAYGIPNLRFS